MRYEGQSTIQGIVTELPGPLSKSTPASLNPFHWDFYESFITWA